MTQEQVLEQPEPMTQEQSEQVVRKRLQLEWIESEWFQVWLKLARGEHQQ
jgi:hypothetical protein